MCSELYLVYHHIWDRKSYPDILEADRRGNSRRELDSDETKPPTSNHRKVPPAEPFP